MKLDEARYRGSMESCIVTMRRRGSECISELAAMLGVPIVLLCLWYLENLGEDVGVREKLEYCLEFYKYREIRRVDKLR